MRAIAIIPARGGSKGIPRKNVLPLKGLPLIAHSIAAAKAAKSLHGFWVSTDDDDIVRVAQGHDAPVLRRPAALATDDAKTVDVLLDALQQLDAQGIAADVIVTLQPTSPLRDVDMVDRAVRLLEEHQTEAVITVSPISAKVGHARDGRYESLVPMGQPRQALEPLYVENGNLYVTRRDTLQSQRSVTGSHPYPLIIDAIAGLDIDTIADWAIAELWLERYPERFQRQQEARR